jgi:hypothetical protein
MAAVAAVLAARNGFHGPLTEPPGEQPAAGMLSVRLGPMAGAAVAAGAAAAEA